MALVVIGGHSRSVGKTSVVAGLIAALPELGWTALKITQYGHGICSALGKACQCACDDHSWAISEEKDRSGDSDTSRFLAAGAVRAWWVRTEQGRLADAMPRVRQIIAADENVIVESNSLLNFLSPDLYVTVLDPATKDFKRSAEEFLSRADAVILHNDANGKGRQSQNQKVAWQRVSLDRLADKPIFGVQPPPYVTRGIVEFVKAKLAASALGPRFQPSPKDLSC
jgi:hypothetical protein